MAKKTITITHRRGGKVTAMRNQAKHCPQCKTNYWRAPKEEISCGVCGFDGALADGHGKEPKRKKDRNRH